METHVIGKNTTAIEIECPVCGSHKKRLKFKIGEYRIQRCNNCRLIHLNPRPTDAAIEALYDQFYFEGHGFDTSVDYKKEFLHPSNLEIKLQILKLNDILELISHSSQLKAPYKLLDVGCGYGLFLKTAAQLGFLPEGIEICPEVAQYVQKNTGYPIHQGQAEQTLATLPQQQYDVITMIEVIEHLTNPKKTLQECQRLLKPGGILFIQTGNIDSLRARLKGKHWDYFTLPGHLCYYSPKSIKYLLQKSGFEKSIICPPRFRHDDSMLLNPLKSMRLLDSKARPKNILGKLTKMTIIELLKAREILLSPGLFAFAIKS